MLVSTIEKAKENLQVENLEWKKLKSEKRFRKSTQQNNLPGVVRSAFEADYDRIVGSSSVRRLQDKAQVFPLQEDDVARTRLTHSIEVSALARSLGKAVGMELEKKGAFTRKDTEELAAILQTAGLVHDLGNPPFGHYGETVIQKWFEKWFDAEGKNVADSLSDQQKNDFLFFDGNVQNLRILMKLQTHYDQFGANFTFATLGTIIKYPRDSIKCAEKGNKKFGFFFSETSQFQDICFELGLNPGARHPATYLLEAADDIIYLCDDIEDGVKKAYIKNNLQLSITKYKEMAGLFNRIESKNPDKRLSLQEQEIAKSRNFRNYVQSYLFSKAVKGFFDNENRIMANEEYEGLELLESEKALIEELQRVTKMHCFSSREVISLELTGNKVITGLLDVFVPAIVNAKGSDLCNIKTYEGKLFSLISKNFVYSSVNPYCEENNSFFEDSEKYAIAIDKLTAYDKIQLCLDFISGMTDTYALTIYQKLFGIVTPI